MMDLERELDEEMGLICPYCDESLDAKEDFKHFLWVCLNPKCNYFRIRAKT